MKRKFAVDDTYLSKEAVAVAEQLPCVKTPPTPCEQQTSRLLRLPDDLLLEIFRFEDNERVAFFQTLPYVCRRFNYLMHAHLKDLVSKVVVWSLSSTGVVEGGEWDGIRAHTILAQYLARGCRFDFFDLQFAPGVTDSTDTCSGVSMELLDLFGCHGPTGINLNGHLPPPMFAGSAWSLGPRLVSFTQTGRFLPKHIEILVQGSPFLRDLDLDPTYEEFQFETRHFLALAGALHLRSLELSLRHGLDLPCVVTLTKCLANRLEVLFATLHPDVFCNEGVAALATLTRLKDIHLAVSDTIPKPVDLSPLRAWKQVDDVGLVQWPFEFEGSISFLTETKTPILTNFWTDEGESLNDAQLHAILRHNQSTLVACNISKSPLITEAAFADLMPTQMTSVHVLQRRVLRAGRTWNNVLSYLQHWPALKHVRFVLCADAPMLEIKNLNPRLETLELACLRTNVSLAQSGLRHLARLRRLVLSFAGPPGAGRPGKPPSCTLNATEVVAELGGLQSLIELDLFVLGMTPEVIKQALALPMIAALEVQKELASEFLETAHEKRINVSLHTFYTRFIVRK